MEELSSDNLRRPGRGRGRCQPLQKLPPRWESTSSHIVTSVPGSTTWDGVVPGQETSQGQRTVLGQAPLSERGALSGQRPSLEETPQGPPGIVRTTAIASRGATYTREGFQGNHTVLAGGQVVGVLATGDRSKQVAQRGSENQPSAAPPCGSQEIRAAARRDGLNSRGTAPRQSAGASIASLWRADRSNEGRSPSTSPPRAAQLRSVPSNLVSLLESFPEWQSKPDKAAISLSTPSPTPLEAARPATVSPGITNSSFVSSTRPLARPGRRIRSPRSPPRAREATATANARPPPVPHQSASLSVKAPRGPDAAAKISRTPSEPGFRMMNIGIEAELYLNVRGEPSKPEPLKTEPGDTNTLETRKPMDIFVEALAAKYNRQVSARYPRMRKDRRPYDYLGEYTEWSLVEDHTILRARSPWGLELVSPIFRAYPGSSWRQDVDVAWKFLQRHYQIESGEKCATHIHISFEAPISLTADDIRRIVRCVIHFEPAIEALVPESRRGNCYVKSNWLEGQRLGWKGKSRADSLAAIDAIPVKNEHEDMKAVVNLVQEDGDRDYCWNFTNLVWGGKRTLEFRKPPGSTSADEVLGWAELAMSLVQAAVKNGVSEKLQKVPSNVGGLRWFLKQAYEPGANQPRRLERIWKGLHDHAAVAPKLVEINYWGDKLRELEARLKILAEDDIEEVRRFAKTTHEPYWR